MQRTHNQAHIVNHLILTVKLTCITSSEHILPTRSCLSVCLCAVQGDVQWAVWSLCWWVLPLPTEKRFVSANHKAVTLRQARCPQALARRGSGLRFPRRLIRQLHCQHTRWVELVPPERRVVHNSIPPRRVESERNFATRQNGAEFLLSFWAITPKSIGIQYRYS